jgi:hypothetical protein
LGCRRNPLGLGYGSVVLVAALVVTWFISEGDIIVGTMLHGSLGCGLLVQGGDESGESLLGLPPEDEDRVMQEAVESGARHRDRRPA